jgi:hypothetical protein
VKRFYGDFVQSLDRCHEYVDRKLRAVMEGWRAVGIEPSFVGVVLTLNFPFGESDSTPVEHILATHLRSDVDPSQVQDAQAKLGVRIADKYFATFQVSNYETVSLERPLMPGMRQVEIKPWEGSVEEVGVELVIDANNRLQQRVERSEAIVTDETVGEILGVVYQAAAVGGPGFVRDGAIRSESLLTEGV